MPVLVEVREVELMAWLSELMSNLKGGSGFSGFLGMNLADTYLLISLAGRV